MVYTMILEDATYEAYGYYPSALSYGSGKLILAACELCGKFRILRRQVYRTFCTECRYITEKTRAKLRKAREGFTPNLGHKNSKETKEKRAVLMKGNTLRLGCKNTEESKRKCREAQSGVKSCVWNGGRKASVKRYKKTLKGKVATSKVKSKRYRELDYVLLMPLKEGEEGHHVTDEYVIGLPLEIHRQFCGYRRKKHRTLILQWLKLNDKKKYSLVAAVLSSKSYPHDLEIDQNR